MNIYVVQRVLGVLLTIFSLTLLPPALVGWLYGDGAVTPFLLAFALTLTLGVLIWVPVMNFRREMRLRDGFVVTVLFWTVLGLFGALPFTLLPEAISLSPTDAVFESLSGLTTTGATFMVGLDTLPHAVLYYRQQLQWLGGMGIIVLAVAILPMLGIGGMQLYRAETPGPVKDTKLTPRIAETAKALWYLYVGLTAACGVCYWLAGMTPFDALAHAFSTVAIGGFSTHDASIGFFQSAAVMAVAVVFMIVSGANFALHFIAVRQQSLRPYWADAEFRAYLAVLATVTLITTGYLHFTHILEGQEVLLHGIFQAVSIATTTGFTTAEYFAWPGFLPVLLLLSSFIGGCATSTAGGMKVIRILLLYKQGKREILRLVHPAAQVPVRIGSKVLPERVVSAVWGFFALYIACFTVMMLVLMATGLDQITAFSAVAACINNLGPGLGEASVNFAQINAPAKWVLCFAMLLGRLEIFTLLVLLTPAFWRR
ncbi:MAG: TrkH family potassium uptake protein [Pseudomonadota bacterium]|nr:TrkH family potassium uptake protein [Pseudomonadota bacterium]